MESALNRAEEGPCRAFLSDRAPARVDVLYGPRLVNNSRLAAFGVLLRDVTMVRVAVAFAGFSMAFYGGTITILVYASTALPGPLSSLGLCWVQVG